MNIVVDSSTRAFGLNFCGLAVEQDINKSTITDKPAALKAYLDAATGHSISDARDIAKDLLGASVFWDCESMDLCNLYYRCFLTWSPQ